MTIKGNLTFEAGTAAAVPASGEWKSGRGAFPPAAYESPVRRHGDPGAHPRSWAFKPAVRVEDAWRYGPSTLFVGEFAYDVGREWQLVADVDGKPILFNTVAEALAAAKAALRAEIEDSLDKL